MPFVTAAKEFLQDAGELSEDENLDLMTDTVGYLLQTAIGIKNAKPTNTVIGVLKDRGYKTSRHTWENKVLSKLRDEGIFIASCKRGMYIIETRMEAERFLLEYRKKSDKEKFHVDFLSDLIEFGHWED